MEAPSPGQSGDNVTTIPAAPPAAPHQQPRPPAIQMAPRDDPRRQLPETGMRVSWRSPTPIREEAPPAITTSAAPAMPSQDQSQHLKKWQKNFLKNREKPPWIKTGRDFGKGKGKGKNKGKSQKKGKDKGKQSK